MCGLQSLRSKLGVMEPGNSRLPNLFRSASSPRGAHLEGEVRYNGQVEGRPDYPVPHHRQRALQRLLRVQCARRCQVRVQVASCRRRQDRPCGGAENGALDSCKVRDQKVCAARGGSAPCASGSRQGAKLQWALRIFVLPLPHSSCWLSSSSSFLNRSGQYKLVSVFVGLMFIFTNITITTIISWGLRIGVLFR
ncbi:unnamed protein product [Symbiodinium pilosum]|uniref:Uncharacterized protein n=1 Tax=Symbiodinium pilosum TaxID=2952 RepID=A0A812M350_SYMPI|nr:unnamed protein product [Symbiodinium pilosum]